MTEITIARLARQLSDFINRVTWQGEGFLIMRGSKPVAVLSPVPSGVRVCDLGDVLAGLPPLLSDDINTFEDDLNAVRQDHNDDLVDPRQS